MPIGVDKIILSGMSFFAHHGVGEDERRRGQRFEIDAEIFLDIKPAAASDDIGKTVDYGLIHHQIAETVTGNTFYLLETLAETAAARILSNQLVEKVVIRVKKLEPPIAGRINSVAVEICRER